MKNKLKYLSAFAFLAIGVANAQVGVGTVTPDPSAVLDVTSTDKGLLLPRLTTTQRNNIASPAAGLTIYNTTTSCVNFYNGTTWNEFCGGTSGGTSSSGGTAVVAGYTCSTGSAGNLFVGSPVSGVSQTITVNVTTPGTYNIATNTVNGVTFAGSGVFNTTGNQNIVLNATGIPLAGGTSTFALNTTVSCPFDREVIAVTTLSSASGRVWMDRNLGATRVATGSTDYLAYGDLYQWGRDADGHQKINWTSSTVGTPANATTTTTLAVTDQANNGGLFIVAPNAPNDWRSNQNNNLWQGSTGVNNPCPAGFHVPTAAEFASEITANGITNAATAYSNNLKFTVSGSRGYSSGALGSVGSDGYYWTSAVSGTSATTRRFLSVGTTATNSFRAYGFSVRCLKD